MSNSQNGMYTPPNAPRLCCIPLPDACTLTGAASGTQGPHNPLLTPLRRAISRYAPAAPRPAPAVTATPPNAPRMRTIPLPDV
ncbi:hypothetical protein M422DRAFT_243456 [Sphaerobolus stellatus SS14]|nr:hypothetical protein M422DRAFT_243456 [Sphaerobolus stellatus SS14]